MLVANNYTHNFQQEISQWNESTFFNPSASLDESKIAESGADFSETINKPSGSIRTRISQIKRFPHNNSIMKGFNLIDSDPMEDLFPKQQRFGAEKKFSEDFYFSQNPKMFQRTDSCDSLEMYSFYASNKSELEA